MGKHFTYQYRKIDIKDIPNIVNKKGLVQFPDGSEMTILFGNKFIFIGNNTVYIESQVTGFGSKRFFICPYCGKKRQHLYYHKNSFKCYQCADLRHRSTNEYKDGLEPMDRKIKGICEKLKADWGSYLNLENGVPEKPYKMRWKTYQDLILKLRHYQYKRGITWLRMVRTFMRR